MRNMLNNTQINITINPQNAEKRGLIYAGDFVYDDQHPDKFSKTLQYCFENKSIAGSPASASTLGWAHGKKYGLYLPQELPTPAININRSITKKTASEHGLKWKEDIIFDQRLMLSENIDILLRYWDGGYVWGESSDNASYMIGIYDRE